MYKTIRYIALAFAFVWGVGTSTMAAADHEALAFNPLLDGSWSLVAHVAGYGNWDNIDSNLAANYSSGIFVENPLPESKGFYRPFPVEATEILFITGDGYAYAITDYAALRSIIDAKETDIEPNILFDVKIGSIARHDVVGNVFSSGSYSEEPFVSMEGDLSDGFSFDRVVWAEDSFSSGTKLKNDHGGINVYVRGTASQIPGDFNNDGVVDILDFGILRASFGSVLGDANYNAAADTDDNGAVGLIDFGVFRDQYGA